MKVGTNETLQANPGGLGSYNAQTNTITINETYEKQMKSKEDYFRQAVLHEIMHATGFQEFLGVATEDVVLSSEDGKFPCYGAANCTLLAGQNPFKAIDN